MTIVHIGPEPLKIPDAAIDAYISASADWLTEYRVEVRAGLAAAAPHIIDAWHQLAQRHSQPFVLPQSTAIHACPEPGSATTPCCNRTPFELLGDRMAIDPALVTCTSAPEPAACPHCDGVQACGYCGAGL